MKSIGDRPFGMLSFLYRSLIVCLILICLIFIAGTIYGVFFHNTPPVHQQIDASRENEQGQTFTGIGRIRVSAKASAADPQPGMVIIFVSFFYHPEDKAFSEELALRVRDFRDIIVGYIGSFPAAELQQINEEDIKAELLRRFNAILRLGQIEILFFTDFMIVG